MQGKLYIIGTGPGDPDLLTLKAYQILQKCPIIVAPKATSEGYSTALSIIEQVVNMAGKDVRQVHFPMKKIKLGEHLDPEIEHAWKSTATQIIELLACGKDIAFPTLGDPAIYSTGYYLYETIKHCSPEADIACVSGISAMSSCSASTLTPVCLGNDALAVIPATFSEKRIKQALEEFDAIVLMKVHRVMPTICRLLEEADLADKAVYVEKAGMRDQRIITDLSQVPKNPHYFSTIIIRKHGTGSICEYQ